MTQGHRLGYLAAAWLLLPGLNAWGDEITLQPRVSGGTQTYRFTFGDLIAPNGNGFRFAQGFELSATLPFFGVGLTASRGHLFADLSGQWSGTGTDHGALFEGNAYPGALTPPPGVVGFEHQFDARFSRHELNAALGWSFDSQLSVYAGYKTARLSTSQALRPDSTPAPEVYDLLFLGNFNNEFNYHGFFAGASYALPLGAWGALSVQASVARLDADFRQSFSGAVAQIVPTGGGGVGLLPLDPAAKSATTGGLSTGLNAGVAWSGTFFWISERLRPLSYTIGVDDSQYRFSTSSQIGNFDEQNLRLRFELRYRCTL